jgi:hypothetical protein
MSTATCPSCGETYLATVRACADCGAALVPETAPVSASGGAGDPDRTGGEAAPAPAWPEGEEEVGYELDDWGPEDRRALTAALVAERVPHEWRDDEVVVPERHADVAEELIDAIDHPHALDVEDAADDGGAELLGALYVVSDILSGDPGASGAVVELLELAPTVPGRSAPYGVDGGRWRAVGDRVAELAALLEADADEDEVTPVAVALRGLLRDLV